MPNDLMEEDDGSPLDLRVLVLYGLARSRFWVIFFTLLGITGGLLAAASQPNTYQSYGRLRLKEGKRERMTPEYFAGLEDSQQTPAMEDEVLLLSDPEIYRRAARSLDPSVVLQPADPERHDTEQTSGPVKVLHQLQSGLFARTASPHVSCAGAECDGCVEAAGRQLQGGTELIPEYGSSVITVTHIATSPERARDFANALMVEFVNRHREEYESRKRFEEQEDKLRLSYESFARANDAYSEHVGDCGFLSLDVQKDTMIRSIDELESSISLKEAERESTHSELESLEELHKNTPKLVDKVTPPVRGLNPEYQVLRAELHDIKMKKIEVISPDIPFEQQKSRIEAYDEQIAEIEKDLSEMPELTEIQREFTQQVPNPEYEAQREQLIKYRIEDRALGRGIQTNRAFLERKKASLASAQKCDQTHSFLQVNIDEAKAKYDQQARQQAELEQLVMLEEDGEANLSIFQSAILPLSKQGPKRAKLVLMGLAAGLFVGAAIAVLRQLLDSRLRYPETVENNLGMRVLGVVPEVRSLRKLSRNPAEVA